MEVKASLSNLGVSPPKARIVANTVRGLGAEAAIGQLRHTAKKVALPMRKLIESAVANASQRPGIDLDRLYIKKIWVDEGPKIKRIFAVSRGRAHPKVRHYCHIGVVLDEK